MRKESLAVALLLVTAVQAQIIHTETQEVLVDVAVTDKKGGGYPGDLKASEFRVWEDGKEQKITSVTRAAGGEARGRYVVLLFDNSSMSPREQNWAHQVARNFIDLTAESNAMMAVVHFGGVLRVGQTFTDNATRLKQAVAAMSVSGLQAEDAGTTTGKMTADFANRDTLRSMENLLRNLETVPGRKSLVYFTPGFAMGPAYSEGVKAVLAAANRSNVAIYPVNVRMVDMTSVAEAMPITSAPTRGGRGGFGGGAAGLARGAPSDVSGDATNPQMDAAARQAVLFTFADDSGGFVVRQPDDTAVLRKIVQEQREYYLLGYTPSADAAAVCHKLRVRVERKDTDWRSRSEYCNRPPGDILSGNPVERTLEARAAADDSGSMDATLQAVYFYAGRGVARTTVAMEIDPAAIAFKREDGKFRATLNVLGVARRGEGGPIAARFSDAVKLEFGSQGEVDTFKRTPYRYQNQFDIAPGEYALAVVVAAGDKFGRVEEALEIAPRETSEFALSGLALSTVFRDANKSAVDAALDELLVDDRKKLVANGVELVLGGSKKLAEGKPAGVYFEIYEPLLADLDAREKLVVAIQMRILDSFTGRVQRDTGLMRLDLSGQGPNPVIAMGQTVLIKDLGAGVYKLELQAIDTAGNLAKRTVEFELE